MCANVHSYEYVHVHLLLISDWRVYRHVKSYVYVSRYMQHICNMYVHVYVHAPADM